MIQRQDKYGNTSTDLGPVLVYDKYGKLKKIGGGGGSATAGTPGKGGDGGDGLVVIISF